MKLAEIMLKNTRIGSDEEVMKSAFLQLSIMEQMGRIKQKADSKLEEL